MNYLAFLYGEPGEFGENLGKPSGFELMEEPDARLGKQRYRSGNENNGNNEGKGDP